MVQHTAPDKHDFLCHFNHHFFFIAPLPFYDSEGRGEERDILWVKPLLF